MSGFRAGVVALLGRPNAGKSTLLNHILGEKLAIVTRKPQTTRSRILGIHTREDAQILFVDTPGLHSSEKALNIALNAQVHEAADDCDVALLLVEDEWGDEHRQLAARMQKRGATVLAVGTKADLGPAPDGWPPEGVDQALRVSARNGEGVSALLDAIVAGLPVSPAFYPEDELSDRSIRWLAAEEVREAAFEALDQEIPYSLAVEVIEFDESRPDLVRIRANLLVERDSQKGIVIGRGGEMIKRIGMRARPPIQKLTGTKVHLELRVKVEAHWSHRSKRLKSLGYT